MSNPRFNPDELIIPELMRERTHLQRTVRPLLERIEQINARLRALCVVVDRQRVEVGAKR